MPVCLRVVITAVLCSVTTGCVFLDKPLVSEKSPNGRFEATVWERKFWPDSSIVITLKNGASQKTVLTDPADRNPLIVQIAWNNDSTQFGVVVFNSGPNLFFAYDVKENRTVDAASMRSKLNEALVHRYKLEQQVQADGSFDPVKWVGDQLDSGKLIP